MTDTEVAIVTSRISLAVAGLAFLWSIVWSIWLYRKTHHPQLRVTATQALAGSGNGTVELVSVAIVNSGAVPSTITSVAFRILGDGEKRQVLPGEWLSPAFLPKHLDIGEQLQAPYADRKALRATIATELSGFAADARCTLVAVVKDATGRRYESNAVKI